MRLRQSSCLLPPSPPAKILYRIRHATWVGRIAMITKGRRGGHRGTEPGGVGGGLRKGRDKRAPAASLTA